MNEFSAAALKTLCQAWSEVNAEIKGHPDPAYAAQLWQMAAHMCIAFSEQHRIAKSDVTKSFEFLADLAHTLATMDREPPAPVIQTAGSMHVNALRKH